MNLGAPASKKRSIKNKFEGQKIVIVIVIVFVIIVKLKRSNFFLMLVKLFLMLIKFLFDASSFFLMPMPSAKAILEASC